MEQEILNQLYRQYSREIYLYLYSFCKNKELAEDLMQETFLKALLSLKDQHTNMRAWLYMVEKLMQTEEGACTHFTSMLHYMSRQTRFLQMFYPELETKTLEESAEYVEKNGVKIYGLLITADRATLQKLDDTEEVYSIYVLER